MDLQHRFLNSTSDNSHLDTLFYGFEKKTASGVSWMFDALRIWFQITGPLKVILFLPRLLLSTGIERWSFCFVSCLCTFNSNSNLSRNIYSNSFWYHLNIHFPTTNLLTSCSFGRPSSLNKGSVWDKSKITIVFIVDIHAFPHTWLQYVNMDRWRNFTKMSEYLYQETFCPNNDTNGSRHSIRNKTNVFFLI